MSIDYKTAYYELLKENDRLRRELEVLKGTGESDVPAHSGNYPYAVAKKTGDLSIHSSAEEKIALFMSLFRGRDDVYARRWYSVKSGKSGYSPVCANEWRQGICDKRIQRCGSCPQRDLVALNSGAVYDHLKGAHEHGGDVIGIFPMTTDECCYFLAVDFDKEEWQEDVAAFRDVCMHRNVPLYVERSRSGNGGHAWVFFVDKIPAATARSLGSALLTEAMNTRHELDFNSYDRLFPNQDTMPKGGFGNLIALPLQGLARKKGNSLFVDESFQPYQDQWAILSGIRKMTAAEVEQTMIELSPQGELGELAETLDHPLPKPWEKKQHAPALNRDDFPEQVNVVYANMLYIEKTGISQRALTRMKRLAAFKNPEFYQAQGMRLPVYNKPRIIDCSDEDSSYLMIPRGCLDDLESVCKDAKVPLNLRDQTNHGDKVDLSFAGKLKPEQQMAADALLAHDTGVLSAATAFGKTVTAAYAIAQRGINTLILVHTGALLTQWKKSLETFLEFHEELEPPPKKPGRKKKLSHVGLLGSGKNTLRGRVDVATMQSLVRGGEVKSLVADYGMIIVDECHHVSAFSFEQILRAATAKYVYGLTATPIRRDGHQPIIFMQCGPIRYRFDTKAQTQQREMEHYVVPRFTNFNLPPHLLDENPGIATIYSELAKNERRNKQIICDVKAAIEAGRNPLLLSGRTEHVHHLATELGKTCANVIELTGSLSAKDKRLTMARLEAIPVDEPFVIVATGKYIGEGFDFPRLDTLFLAMPVSWKGILQQYAGRLHRDYAGKKEVIIYDYVDLRIKMLENMYHKRVRGYAAMGYRTRSEGALPEQVGIIFDQTNFLSPLTTDIKNAKNHLLIVSPYVRKGRVTQMVKLLSAVKLNNVRITIVTRAVEDYKPADQGKISAIHLSLEDAGCKVVCRPAIHQKFVVIDDSILWYGSINLLSYGQSEESMMRFENSKVAQALLDTLVEREKVETKGC